VTMLGPKLGPVSVLSVQMLRIGTIDLLIKEYQMKISKRWIPAAVVASLITAGTIALPMQANAVDLPDLTPQEVMLLMDGEIQGFSGTIVKTSELGLPPLQLSSMMNEDMMKEMEEKLPEGFEDFVPTLIEQNLLTQAVELIAGTHKIRVYASSEGSRVQILDTMSQRDFIVNRDEFWFYDSRKATAITGSIDMQINQADIDKAQLDAEAKLAEYAAQIQLDISNPEAVANYLMERIGESTTVSVGKDHRVAGRTAYQLIAQPNASNSLIESVVISVDSETGMALDVKVYSVEQAEPAMHVGFESISFDVPAASTFSFTPPAGTIVETFEAPADLQAELEKLQAEGSAMTEEELLAYKAELEAKYANEAQPEVIGEGWESVMHLSAIPAEVPMDLLENELFADLMTTVAGGKMFSTPVLNVLITDSGEVYAGAVTIAFLQEVAAR
jgi:outer membrane lipoprotein-sorting protein